jgi:hypothetical protein
MNKLGKEIMLLKAKKNIIESDINAIINVLKDNDYEKKAYEVDSGKTDNDYSFVTWRFYFKKK